MNILKANKHYILALAIMFVVVSLSDTTYSLFLKADSTNDFTYNTGILDLQFVEDEQIAIENAFPTIDSIGMKTEPYTLRIKNVGSLPYLFNLEMLSPTEENVINSQYIKFKVNDGRAQTLFESTNIIASNIILYPDEEKSFDVRVWLDINTPNTEMGKTFMAKIVTNGQAVYRTLDTSGANHPNIMDEMIPVYYEEETKSWKKADGSNMNSAYEWYNYDTGKWANIVNIKDTNKQIFDITKNNHLKIEDARTNNENYITDEKYLDLNLSNYSYNNISSIFRIKFNDLTVDKAYIISNNKMSLYYDINNKNFKFEIDNQAVETENYNIEKGTWYIIGYTYNKNKLSIYVNGNKILTQNITGNISSTQSFKLGTDKTTKELSNLEIGDIYIYKDILTEEEIKNNYSTTINIIYDNLLAGYNDFEPKTLKEYYLSKDLGYPVSNEDVASFYVWIPRYKYKLWNVTGENKIDSYDAYSKGIDIIFENQKETSGVIKCENNICYSDNLLITKVTSKDNNKYHTHPAFSNKNEELTGIWISKYEISTSSKNCNNENLKGCISDNLTIESKPQNNVWRNNAASNFYQNIKKLGTNYHLIKNTEWGALTYLTHSKYGLCQNNECKEIGTNKTYISGNEMTDSSTYNMYGIFDISGSSTEFVMTNYTENSNETLTSIDSSDYDFYTPNTFILGDATKEILLENASWYNNKAIFIDETNNWFIRGGIGPINENGIFYYNATTDSANQYISTRISIK